MTKGKKDSPLKVHRFEFRPLTDAVWDDFERLFGERGACGGCWCMYWRVPRSQFEKQKGEKNRQAMKSIVVSGQEPGILAYVNGQPAGWCSVAPREEYTVLERSRVLKRVDQEPVWSIVCLFVARPYRRTGLSVRLIEAAVEYVRSRGGRVLEGYPIEPRKDAMPDAFAWTGIASAFLKAGFREVARRSETRPVMRREIRSARPR